MYFYGWSIRQLAPLERQKLEIPISDLNLDDLTLNLFSDVKDAKGGAMPERACGRSWVKEKYSFALLIGRSMSMAIHDRIHLIKFVSDP